MKTTFKPIKATKNSRKHSNSIKKSLLNGSKNSLKPKNSPSSRKNAKNDCKITKTQKRKSKRKRFPSSKPCKNSTKKPIPPIKWPPLSLSLLRLHLPLKLCTSSIQMDCFLDLSIISRAVMRIESSKWKGQMGSFLTLKFKGHLSLKISFGKTLVFLLVKYCFEESLRTSSLQSCWQDHTFWSHSSQKFNFNPTVSLSALQFLSHWLPWTLWSDVLILIIQVIIYTLTVFEKDFTHTNYQASLSVKSVFAQLINCIVIPVMIKKENIYGRAGLVEDVFWLVISCAFIDPILKMLDVYYLYTRIKYWLKCRPCKFTFYCRQQNRPGPGWA